MDTPPPSPPPLVDMYRLLLALHDELANMALLLSEARLEFDPAVLQRVRESAQGLIEQAKSGQPGGPAE